MTTTRQQLENLIDRFMKGKVFADEMARELRSVLRAHGDANFRERITSALSHTDIYCSPRKADRYGGVEKVRAMLLQDLTSAAHRAGQLRGDDTR